MKQKLNQVRKKILKPKKGTPTEISKVLSETSSENEESIGENIEKVTPVNRRQPKRKAKNYTGNKKKKKKNN